MIGRLLLRNHKDVVECYSSPALRSIQTADSMLEGMNKKHLVPIKIEPALFECYSWYNGQLVNFMNLRDLTLNGFNIDRFYTPTINFVSPNESELDYYNRSAIFVQRLETTGKTNRGILVLGHAATPEVLSRALLKQPPRPKALLGLAAKVDFADLSIMEKEHATGKWKFKNSIL